MDNSLNAYRFVRWWSLSSEQKKAIFIDKYMCGLKLYN